MEIEEQVNAQMNVTRFLETNRGFSEGIVDAYDSRFSQYHNSIPQGLRYVFKSCNGSALSKATVEDDCCLNADRLHVSSLSGRVGAVLCDSLGTPFGSIKTEGAKTFIAWDNLSEDNRVISICGGIYGHNAFRVREILRSEPGFFYERDEWSYAVLIDGLVIPSTKEVTMITTSAPSLGLDPLRMFNFGGSEGQSIFFRLLFSRREEFRQKMNAQKFLLFKHDGSVEQIDKPELN